MKAQSAMEYLMTYGWAILIIGVVLSTLYALGVFSPANYVGIFCVFPADFSCLSSSLSASGNFIINIEQSTSTPINITAIACSTSTTPTNIITFVPTSSQIYLNIGSNYSISGNGTATLKCFSGSTVFSGSLGSVYTGYVIINYTSVATGFPHVIIGQITEKVVTGGIPITTTTVTITTSTPTTSTSTAIITTTSSTTTSIATTSTSTSTSTSTTTTIVYLQFGFNSIGSTSYPVTNIGNTNAGSTVISPNYFVCDKYTTTAPLTAISIETYGAVNGNEKVSIYDNDATNSLPKNLLFTEVAQAITANQWNTINIPNIYLAAGTYWLCFKVDLSNVVQAYVATANKRVYYSDAYANAFPNPAPSSGYSQDNSYQDNIYFVGVQIEGYAKATKAILPSNAIIQSVSFYSHATGDFRLAIYSDSSGPSSKLWESGNTAASVSAWTTVSISAGTPTSLALNSGTYWLAWQWDSVNSGPSYTVGSLGDGNYIALTYDSFPSTWSGGTLTSEDWSAYAIYYT